MSAIQLGIGFTVRSLINAVILNNISANLLCHKFAINVQERNANILLQILPRSFYLG